MGIFWAVFSSCLGLLIVLLAVGIPFWMTHKRMRPHHDLTEGRAYLDAVGKTPEDAAVGRPAPAQDDRTDRA